MQESAIVDFHTLQYHVHDLWAYCFKRRLCGELHHLPRPPFLQGVPLCDLFLPSGQETLTVLHDAVPCHQECQTITETHIQTRKLHAVSVLVSNPPFFNSIFHQTNTTFSQNRQYPTPFYLSALYYHGNP